MTEFQMPDGTDNLGGTLVDGVELPFEAVYFYWRNGSRREKDKGVLTFGGWAVDKAEADAFLPVIPPTFEEHALVNAQGNEYSIYAIRNLFVAPIEKRERWYTTDQGGNRSHLQLLGLVSTFGDGVLYPLGVQVLSAKGLRTKDLKDHLSEWNRVTATIRKEHFNNVSVNYFYMSIGSFGEVPQYEETGHGSVVTPIGLYYKELSKDNLLSRFVGKDNVTLMRERFDEAQEWLTDWDKKDKAVTAEPELQEVSDDYPF